MKKIKVLVLSLVTVAVLSFGLNNPVNHQDAAEKTPVVQYMTEPGGGV
ncbi:MULTISPECIES: Phr family secreted Rap phosphatase inhibitor [Bacillus cereus group]|nr:MULTISPECIES: Phr family secreted Rap phosphatase inhibitor [Bacillus cereus group]PFD30375.1 Phr family secreted Rap phosphatase inhibitor [Bacillus thuringiensis]PFF91211.1 Phr family secreted Rap phosphatase inhibitor [Bacillus cereus]